jgi:hypothetical protein
MNHPSHKKVPLELRSNLDAATLQRIIWGTGKTEMLYMIPESFKNKDAAPVCRRFREQRRMAPDGLIYLSCWVDDKLERCYQPMETRDRPILDEWMDNGGDLVEFEAHPVITAEVAANTVALRV